MVVTLSLSGAKMNGCEEVISKMLALGISGDATLNTTVLDGVLEQGCRVRVASQPQKEHAKRLWEAIRTRCELTCGHVSIDDATNGCALDVFRPSACPGAVTPSS